MKKNLTALLILLVVCLASSCDDSSNPTYFVTKLGDDTLAIERFEKTENGISAQVLLRSPNTFFYDYQLEFDGNKGIQKMEVFRQAPEHAFTMDERTLTQTVSIERDSLTNKVETRQGSRDFTMVNARGTLPFIDMVHWPYELAFNAAALNATDSIHQMLLTGRRISDFIIHKASSNSWTIRHPSRGVMAVDVNDSGDLIKIDAALTTRKLIVTRATSMDFEGVVKDFAQRDKNGSPFSGNLSGAVEQDFSFKNTDFSVSYGSPKKRGRKIFGGIVSFGQRWRTGANRATHFKSSKNLKIGELIVPAGEYTLFTIPEANGGTLIINKQTGQNGRSYDESRDLGRVPMRMDFQNTVTEDFTIKVVESDLGGSLQLIWDKSILYVNFEIL